MKQDAKAAVIRKCFLFSASDAESVARIAAASSIVKYASGEMVFATGDPADGLRIVLSGLVRVWIANEEGKELTLSLLEPGDPFGEIALFDGLPRTANATEIEGGECLYLPKSFVDGMLEKDSAFGRHIVLLLCEILRRNTDVLGGFAFRGLDARLARVLSDLAITHGVEGPGGLRLSRKFSQTDLGQMLGVTREAVNKRLTSLVLDGLVRLTEGHIIITDLDRLRQRGEAQPHG